MRHDISYQRLMAKLMLPLLFVLGCQSQAGDKNATFTSNQPDSKVVPPQALLSSTVYVTGLKKDPVIIKASDETYRIFESGILSVDDNRLSISEQPGDTTCFLFEQYNDNQQHYLECYDNDIEFSNTKVPIGRFYYNLSKSYHVIYSQEELVWYPDDNATRGFSYQLTNNEGLFLYEQNSNNEVMAYFTDSASISGSSNYVEIEQALTRFLTKLPLFASIKKEYTHEIPGQLLDVEYSVQTVSKQETQSLVAELAQRYKYYVDLHQIQHIPIGYSGTPSDQFHIGVTIFPSSSPAHCFISIKVATKVRLGEGEHFSTTDIKEKE